MRQPIVSILSENEEVSDMMKSKGFKKSKEPWLLLEEKTGWRRLGDLNPCVEVLILKGEVFINSYLLE